MSIITSWVSGLSNFNPADFPVTITLGLFDGEVCYEATNDSFVDICEYGDTPNEAFDLMMDSICTSIDLLNINK